jgi:hypothetical protein
MSDNRIPSVGWSPLIALLVVIIGVLYVRLHQYKKRLKTIYRHAGGGAQ